MIETLLMLFFAVLVISAAMFAAIAFFGWLLAKATRNSRHICWILPCASAIVFCVFFSLNVGIGWDQWLPWRFPIMTAVMVSWAVHGHRRMRRESDRSYKSLWNRSVCKSSIVLICIFASLFVLMPHHHT